MSLISALHNWLNPPRPPFDGRHFYEILVAVAKRHHIVGLVLDKDPPIDLTFWDDMAMELTSTIRDLQ